MQRWWERYPGRLEFELKALEDAGVSHRLDDNARRTEARIVVRAEPIVADRAVAVTCVFPDTYPFFRPEVYADGISLPRHQNPLEKNLCLLPQPDLEHVLPWDSEWTLAQLLTEQLPKVFGSGGTPDRPTLDQAHDEVPQGEPFGEYVPTGDSLILFDGSTPIPAVVNSGRLELALVGRSLDRREFRGVVLDVQDAAGNVLARANEALQRWARAMSRLSLPWQRAHRGEDPLDVLAARHPVPQLNFGWHHVAGRAVAMSAVVIAEETGNHVTSDGWLFAMTEKIHQTNGWAVTNPWFVRGGRAGEDELFERIPELRFMRSCKIGVVGLGGIGAPSALEFARCGAEELRLLDHDFVAAGTAVRWPRGFDAAGLAKPRALAEVIAVDWPYTRVRKFSHRIGNAPRSVNHAEREAAVLTTFFDGLDLVYDASGDLAVENFVATSARERSIPIIRVSTTNGAWGGLVARFSQQNSNPCPHCLLLAIRDGHIALPASAPDAAGIQPRGCRSRTFTGASPDLGDVALNGVRLALATLSERRNGSYPAVKDDVLVLNFREPISGHPLWPGNAKWYRLERHAECKMHGA